MGIVVCSVCKGRVTLSIEDKKLLDASGGPFICSSTCVMGWFRRHKPPKKKVMDHPGIFSSEMGLANDCYSIKIGMGFRSSYELSVAEWMWDADIGFMYEPYTFLLETDTSSYTPDYYVPDYGCFLEVKGKWHNRKKLVSFRRLYPHIPLLVIPWPIRKTFQYSNKRGRIS